MASLTGEDTNGVWQTGLCVSGPEAGGVRRRMLLAWVPQAFHQAEGECRVLAKEDRGQQVSGPDRQPYSAENGLEGAENLGA